MATEEARTANPILLADLLNEQIDKRIDILRRIDDVGSISQAARGAGVSYKAAWQAIETLGNLAGGPLVEKVVGGARGGGTKLSATGREVLELVDELARARAEVLARFRARGSSAFERIGSTTLQTSLRNQFPATIVKMKIGSALVRLTLRIDDTHLLRASVTKESAQLLGLAEGKSVLALTKATGVEITADFPKETHGGEKRPENQLVGEVIRSERAAKGGECSLRLPSGLVIVGFAKRNHGLHMDQKAVASISPSAIVIGLTS